MNKPLIGLTTGIHPDDKDRYALRIAYVNAIERAGGQAVILPPVVSDAGIENSVATLAGLVLTGGEDIDPCEYGESPHQRLGRVDENRDRFELTLTRKWLAGKKPLLGICRGIQVLNVAAGGALIQDIGSQLSGSLVHNPAVSRSAPVHAIAIKRDSLLDRVIKSDEEVWVNSIHHQAVSLCAQGFEITARASDGVVEAIESLHHPFVLGVEWHPEDMTETTSNQYRLFEHLVTAAAR